MSKFSQLRCQWAYWKALQSEEPAGAVLRPGVEVLAGGGDAGVAEGGLDEVNRRHSVEGMTGVGVPPMPHAA